MSELLHKRGQIVDQMRELIKVADAEGRDFTAEESAIYNAMDADQEALKKRADREASLAAIEADASRLVDNAVRINVDNGGKKSALSASDYTSGFDTYCRVGKSALDGQILNALQVGTASEGGYITPEEFETQLVVAMQDHNEFRNLVNVISTGSDRNIPVESSLGSATWTAEEAAYTESDAAFGQVILGAHKLGTIIKVSEELLEDSMFDLQGYLAMNFGKRFANAEEAAIVAGTGSGQPTGLVGSASAGVTAASATAITSDEVIDLYHSLSRPYRANATWTLNDSTAKLIRKLKDGNGQYLWQPGLVAGQPDSLLSRPVVASDAMPAATTGLTSMLFGDLSYYTLAERSGRVLQRLNELYAANGQVGFRMNGRLDGKLTLAESVKKLVQA